MTGSAGAFGATERASVHSNVDVKDLHKINHCFFSASRVS